jgi:putative DNA primase/helicase
VALFGERIRELLAQPLATDAHGCLTPAVLDLSPQARAEWIGFHDEVERELGARGKFRGVRDVAAKAAENVARRLPFSPSGGGPGWRNPGAGGAW